MPWLASFGFSSLVPFIVIILTLIPHIIITITVIILKNMIIKIKRYSSAVKNCKVAGRVGAQFLNWLVHQKQVEICYDGDGDDGDDDAVNEKEGDDDDGGCSIPQLACSPRTVGDIIYNNDD